MGEYMGTESYYNLGYRWGRGNDIDIGFRIVRTISKE